MTSVSLSTGLNGLVQVFTRGAANRDVMTCMRHEGPSMVGANTVHVLVSRIDPAWVPDPLVKLLEESGHCRWRCCLARRPSAAAVEEWSSISALVALRTFDRVLRDRRWVWPDDEIGAMHDGSARVLPPTIIIDGRSTQACIWALEQPLDVSTDERQARALDLLRRLGRATGCPMDEAVTLGDVAVPLPGTAIPDRSDEGTVAVATLDLTRIYTVDTVNAALAAAEEHHAV